MRFKAPLFILLLVLLAFALRLYRLDYFSLRGDEAFTVLFVQKPLAQMWHETLTVEPNPPLLYFLLRGWIALAGDSEFAARFFSLFFGVLCVPLVYRLTRVIFSSHAMALFAAFLLAVNPYQIWHSQDVRNYAMWQALSLAALIPFWLWYKTSSSDRWQGGGRYLAAFVVLELAALYCHYYEAFILLALNLFVLLTTWRQWRKLLTWLGAQVVLALLYLPYPLILSNRVAAYGEGSGREGVALWEIARETFSAFVLGETLDASLLAWLWLPFALLALAGLVYLWTRDWRRGLYFTLYIAVPTLAVFGLNLIRPLYLARYLNGIAPAYYILLAYAIVTFSGMLAVRRGKRTEEDKPLRSPKTSRVLETPRVSHQSGVAKSAVRVALAGVLALLALLALANYWSNPAYAKAPDWRGLTDLINANAEPGDLIVQNFPEMSLLYYDRTRLPVVVYPETYLPDAKTTRQLNAVGSNFKRVWFIPAAPDFWDPDEFVEKWLDHRADLLNQWQVGDFRLRLYGTASEYLNAMSKVGADFGGTLTLLGYRVEPMGNQQRLVLYWRAQQTPTESYYARMSVDDVPVQTDGAPVRGAYPTNVWRKNEIVVDQYDLQVQGAAELRLQMCRADGGDCLPVSGAGNLVAPDTLVLPLNP